MSKHNGKKTPTTVGVLNIYEPPAFRGAETLLPFFAEDILLLTMNEDPFA